MKAKRRKLVLLLCIVLIGIIAATFISFKIIAHLLVENAKRDAKWQEDMYANGPWGEKAIWKSEEEDIYLICQPDEKIDTNAPLRVKSTAYILYGEQCVPMDFDVRKGVEKVEFCTYDGDIVFEGNIQLAEGGLIITNLNDYGTGITRNRTEIVIRKFPYQELIDNLPFSMEQ